MHSLLNRLRSPSAPSSNPRPSTSSHSHSNSVQSQSHSHSTGTSPSANTFGNPSVSAGRVSSSRELPASPLPSPTSGSGHASVPNSPIIEGAPPVSPLFPSPLNQTSSPSTITQVPSTPTQSNPGGFTGLRPIAANQDALLSSPPARSKSPPSFSTSNIETSLSPRPATERRGSTSEKKLDLHASPVLPEERTPKPDTIHEEHIPPLPTTTSPDELASTPDEITPMPEGGNLSRSSSRRTTGLFSAVPFTGGTGWSTFGRSRKGRKDSHPTAVAEQEGRLTQSVSRTSSQSRNTSNTSKSRTKSSGGTKSPGVSRSGSTKHPRRDVTSDFGEVGIKERGEGIEHIEQSGYSRIPIHDSHDQRYNKDSNSDSPVTPHSPKHTPSTPNHPSTPKKSSKGETQPPSPTQTTSPTSPLSRNTSEKRKSRLETFPPRTAVVKPEEGVVPGSLPFTFGRHAPSKPSVEGIFPIVDEFGISQTQPSQEPFPSIGTPISEFQTNPLDQRKYLPSGSSNTASSSYASPVRENIPSLTSDTSNDGTRLEGKDSIPSLGTLGGGKLFPSLGSTGDILSSSNDTPVLSDRAKEMSDERRRIKSIGSGGLVRRSSSGRLLSGGIKRGRSVEALGGMMQEPVIVYSAEIPEDQQKRRFPSQDDLPPTSSSDPMQETEASTSQPTSAHRHATSGSATVVGSPSSSEHLHVQPPEVTVQHPTPRPSPSRNVSTSTRLAELFNRSNSLSVPEGHAHPSGIGVAGIESHSRRASLKVMGKRPRGEEGDTEEGEVVVYDESRSRKGSRAPSSYQRKRVKLSNASSNEPSTAVARQTSPLVPTNSRHSTAPGTAPSSGSSRPRSMSSTRPKSITSVRPGSITSTRPGTSMSKSRRPRPMSSMSQASIPISAIVRPRAPSIHPSVTSRREGDRGQQMRYQHPLHNRNQRRRKKEVWADSWTFGGGDLVIQQYLFLAGFLLFPLWWIGVILPIYRWEDHHQVHWSWLPPKEPDREASAGSELKGTDVKGKGKPQQPTVGLVDRSNSGLWADPEPYEENKRRLWRGRCLYAACVGTIFWVIVIVLVIVLSRRKS